MKSRVQKNDHFWGVLAVPRVIFGGPDPGDTPKITDFGSFLGHFWTPFLALIFKVLRIPTALSMVIQLCMKYRGSGKGSEMGHFWGIWDPVWDPFLGVFGGTTISGLPSEAFLICDNSAPSRNGSERVPKWSFWAQLWQKWVIF